MKDPKNVVMEYWKSAGDGKHVSRDGRFKVFGGGGRETRQRRFYILEDKLGETATVSDLYEAYDVAMRRKHEGSI